MFFFTKTECGRTFQENKASFISPVFPPGTVSDDGERCEWRITATHGERIVLNITELDVFKGDNCKYDYVEIRDGYWHKSPLLGLFLLLLRFSGIKSTEIWRHD